MPDYPQTPDYLQSAAQKSRLTGMGWLGLHHRGIFHHALVREFSRIGLYVFFILLGIVVFTQLIRLLGDSVKGVVVVDGVLALLGFSALNYLPVLLSLSLFLSVLLTLTRSYRDSEMVVWFGSGIGLTRWIAPIMWYALPVIGVIALLSLVLSPWAMSRAEEFKRRLNSRDDVAIATPGMFRESSQADRVFFVENVDLGQNRVGNIFVQSVQHDKIGTMMAKQGLQETAPNGDRFLVLLNGTRYEGSPGKLDFRIVQFERYAMRIEEVEAQVPHVWPKSLSTMHLIENPGSWNTSELQWRLGMPLSALVLVLFALPLSFVNPRAGRSFNLILALVLYMFYNNLISVTNTWVGQGKISPFVGFIGIHGLMFSLMVVWFYHRTTLASGRWWARRIWRERRATAAPPSTPNQQADTARLTPP